MKTFLGTILAYIGTLLVIFAVLLFLAISPSFVTEILIAIGVGAAFMFLMFHMLARSADDNELSKFRSAQRNNYIIELPKDSDAYDGDLARLLHDYHLPDHMAQRLAESAVSDFCRSYRKEHPLPTSEEDDTDDFSQYDDAESDPYFEN